MASTYEGRLNLFQVIMAKTQILNISYFPIVRWSIQPDKVEL